MLLRYTLGTKTVHHTYGIAYQNVEIVNSRPLILEDVDTPGWSRSRNKKRLFLKVCSAVDPGVKPYIKKPRLTLFPTGNVELVPPRSLDIGRKNDLLWMPAFNFLHRTPYWMGWNSLRYHDETPHQKVFYIFLCHQLGMMLLER